MSNAITDGIVGTSFKPFASAASAGGRQGSAVRLAPARLPPGLRLLGPLAAVLIWEASSRLGLLSLSTLVAPSTAIVTGLDMLRDGSLLPHLVASAARAYAGLFLGVVVGVVLALVSGLTRSGEALIDGIVQAKRAVPTLALIPLGIIWLGIGEAMKIFLIFMAVMVPIYINTHAALRGIDIGYVELARTLGLTRSEFIRNVALPGALPGFFVALRLAVALCWTSLVVLELINTQAGIGYLMNRARDWGQTDIIVVGIFIYAVLGLASDAVVRMVEARALSYRRSLGS
jgi:sulfonate transport system permease protein